MLQGLCELLKGKDKHAKKRFQQFEEAEERQRQIKLLSDKKDVFVKFVNGEFLDIVKEWARANPQPFEIGEMVMNNYYQWTQGKGWYSSPRSLEHNFPKCKQLHGSFELPVHKIWINTEHILDKLIDMGPSMYNDKDSVLIYYGQLREACLEMAHKKDGHLEWAIDFDWETLRIPNIDSPDGWLNLKWGGLSACHFLSSNTARAKKQKKLWKKELVVQKHQKQYNKLRKELDNEILIYKNIAK
jgi:hypothetical protein